MKPNGTLFAKEKDDLKVSANLKLTGFCNIVPESSNNIFSAQKPNFEVGASSRLSFAQPAVWSLSDGLVDDQIELINEGMNISSYNLTWINVLVEGNIWYRWSPWWIWYD